MKKVRNVALPFLIAGVIFFSALTILNRNAHAIKGVLIADIELRNLPKEEAQILLEKKIKEYDTAIITIRAQNGAEVRAFPKEFGISFNVEESIDKAYNVGKDDSWHKDLIKQGRALFFAINHPLDIAIDYNIMTHFINNKLNTAIHRPAQNASYVYNVETEGFEFTPASEGRIIDIYELQNRIIERAQNLSNEIILLKQSKDIPKIYDDEAGQALAKAQNILGSAPYTISAQDDKWEIEKEDLISWIIFEPKLRQNKYILETNVSLKKIEDYLLVFSPGLAIAPTNAKFRMEDGKVVEFDLARPGRKLNLNQSASVLAANIKNLQTNTELVFDEIPAEITAENIDNLGINALLGKGESDFAGSPGSRVHNIRVGSDRYQGMLIAPNEEFSFNKNLGPVNAAMGYLPELVIRRDRTIPEYGGGLCQVSTTLFRAAVFSGLEITERKNHSYHVVYYGKPGFDATIYPPHPDLAFRNNTPGHILIQYRIEGTRLTFEIYGQDDGRIVEVDGPHTYDHRPDGSVKAWLTQTVKDENGTVLFEETFNSNYRSPALFPVNRNPFE
jgi:vancomycin resistance protein YoaR